MTIHMNCMEKDIISWKKNGHGWMSMRNAIKQSCDIYFYEVARLLGVDKLSLIAKRYGLGSKVLEDFFSEEKKGIVPSTKWKKQVLDQSWYLGETVITGIGQRLHSDYSTSIMFDDSAVG